MNGFFRIELTEGRSLQNRDNHHHNGHNLLCVPYLGSTIAYEQFTLYCFIYNCEAKVNTVSDIKERKRKKKMITRNLYHFHNLTEHFVSASVQPVL